MRPYRFTSSALVELPQAILYYEQRENGLGTAFLNEIGAMTTKRVQAKASKKNSSKKAIISKAATSGAAVEKGRSFEDQVADLYRLLGARVTQNIEIHQKKVDILATFRIPGSSREHTVIVECKDEQRSVAANKGCYLF